MCPYGLWVSPGVGPPARAEDQGLHPSHQATPAQHPEHAGLRGLQSVHPIGKDQLGRHCSEGDTAKKRPRFSTFNSKAQALGPAASASKARGRVASGSGQCPAGSGHRPPASASHSPNPPLERPSGRQTAGDPQHGYCRTDSQSQAMSLAMQTSAPDTAGGTGVTRAATETLSLSLGRPQLCSARPQVRVGTTPCA